MSFKQKLCNLFYRAYNFIKDIFKGDDADYLTYDTKFFPYIIPKKKRKKKKVSLAEIAKSHTQHIKAHQEILKNAIKSEKKAKKKAKKVSKK